MTLAYAITMIALIGAVIFGGSVVMDNCAPPPQQPIQGDIITGPPLA